MLYQANNILYTGMSKQKNNNPKYFLDDNDNVLHKSLDILETIVDT